MSTGSHGSLLPQWVSFVQTVQGPMTAKALIESKEVMNSANTHCAIHTKFSGFVDDTMLVSSA